MSSIKKRFSVGWLGGITLGLLCGMTAVLAGSINHNFQTGDTLTAAQLNETEAAITGNAGDIATNAAAIANLQGNVAGTGCVANTAAGDDADGMVRVGSICVDKYQAQADFAGAGCLADGVTSCGTVKAFSSATGTPAVAMSWAQAQRACTNAGKRLLTPGEWMAGFLAGAFTATTDSFDFVDGLLTAIDTTGIDKAQGGYIGKHSGATVAGDVHFLSNVDYDAAAASFSTFSWHFRCGR